MISVLIMYPRGDDTTFDMQYYTSSHMPMFAESLGAACHGWGVIEPSGDKYHAIAWVMVDSQDDLNATMATHGAKVIGDVPNYTNTSPEMIIGNVVV
jgi:uncharacterized protein (TIGR02118 family)